MPSDALIQATDWYSVNLPEECGLQRGDTRGGVGVAIARQHFPEDVILYKLQRPSGCSIIAVHN
jgi:hypothetical protein